MKLRKLGVRGAWASAVWEVVCLPGSRVYRRHCGGWRLNTDRCAWPAPAGLLRIEFETRRELLDALRFACSQS